MVKMMKKKRQKQKKGKIMVKNKIRVFGITNLIL